jgi:membrane protein
MSQTGGFLSHTDMSPVTVFDLLKTTATKWNEHDAPRLGAALAYYTLLSLAPLAVLVVGMCSLVLSKNNAEQQLFWQAQELVGTSGAKTLETLVDNTQHASNGLVAGIMAVAALIFGASGVFVELRDSLNTIWEAPPPAAGGVRTFILRRLVTFGMVLALGVLLLASLLISAGLGIAEKYFIGMLPPAAAIGGEIANLLITLAAITALFALIFKFVPDVRIGWEDVGTGALVTAVLFTLGRGLLAFYMGTAAVGSTYGAAGSLVALVVWVYYSAQIFFFGAVFTRVYADYCGSRVNRRSAKPVSIRRAKAR